jgi:hypothetical protein
MVNRSRNLQLKEKHNFFNNQWRNHDKFCNYLFLDLNIQNINAMCGEINLQLHSIFDNTQLVGNYIIIEMYLTEIYSS